MAEVLHYFEGIRDIDLAEIPVGLMCYFERNAENNYECSFDYMLPLAEIIPHMSEKTVQMILRLTYDYWCKTEEEKQEILELMQEYE